MAIKNVKLKEFLTILFNKSVDFITVDDIQKVESVRISTMDEKREHGEKLDDLQQFGNLTRVIIADSMITEVEISVLSSISKLVSIEFERCAFSNDMLISLLNNIQTLVFNNCFIRDYGFFNGLDKLVELQILNPGDETILDLWLLNKFPSLKKLYLERCILTGFNFFGNPSLEEVSLLNTTVDDFHFINKCHKLSSMFIPKRYINNPVVRANSGRINFRTDIIEFALEAPESEPTSNNIRH